MKRLLVYIVSDFTWLLEEGSFKLSSSYYDSQIDGAWIEISSGELAIALVTERDRIFLEFAPRQDDKKIVKGITLDLLANNWTENSSGHSMSIQDLPAMSEVGSLK